MVPCGHLFSDRAVLQMVDGRCTLCNAPFEKDNIVPVIGSHEQVNQLRERIENKKIYATQRKRKKSGNPAGGLVEKVARRSAEN